MTRIILLIKWLVRAWPVLISIALAYSHYYVLLKCNVNVAELNKTIALFLQVIGGLLIIYSIDSNIGIVTNKSLFSYVKNWIVSIPLFSKSITLQVDSAKHTITGHPVKLRVGSSTETLEGKVEYIQQQIEWLKEDLNDEVKHLKDIHNNSEKRLNEEITKLHGKVGVIDTKMNKVSLGGVKIQFFGILLMVHGSISSYFA